MPLRLTLTALSLHPKCECPDAENCERCWLGSCRHRDVVVSSHGVLVLVWIQPVETDARMSCRSQRIRVVDSDGHPTAITQVSSIHLEIENLSRVGSCAIPVQEVGVEVSAVAVEARGKGGQKRKGDRAHQVWGQNGFASSDIDGTGDVKRARLVGADGWTVKDEGRSAGHGSRSGEGQEKRGKEESSVHVSWEGRQDPPVRN